MTKQKIYSLERHSFFVLSLTLSFCIIFGVASMVAYNSYTKATDATIRSNQTRATLLAKLIQEHQRAALGVLRSYSSRGSLIDSVQRKDFERTLRHLSSLVKDNPEMDWPFIANPDSTVWVNFPVDKRSLNKDLSYRDWYKGVSREWKPYISSVFKMIVGEKDLAVAVSVPIFDEKKKAIGILSTAQSTAFFQKIFSEVGLDFDASITLIDQERHIIYSNRFPYTRQVIDYPSFDFVRTAMKGERDQVVIQDSSDGDRIKYLSFAPVEGLGWSIIVEKAKSEVLRSEYSYFTLIAAISFLTYAVVALSLVHLRRRRKQIKALEKLNEELDTRVRERTAELEVTNEGLMREITERKRAEEALQITQFSVEHAPESVLWIDPKGKLDYVNEAVCRALGYSREELVSMSLWDIDPDFPPESWSAHWQNLPNRGPLTRESRHRAKGGKTFPIEITGDYLKYGDKEYNVAFVRDITERKHAEEEKVALVDQLRQSQKMEAIGRLAGGIAHDFNNLLTVMKGYSQLSLVEMKEEDPLRENIEEIKKSADRAADLTRQLLAFSRRQIMEMKVLDLNNLFRNLDKMLRRVIGEDIELVTILDENLGRVKTDTGQIEQVIMNLAVNAKDAMPKGGKLTIETANVDLDGAYARAHVAVKPGPYVMLSVSDTGVGMTPEVKERVFEPFFTTKDIGKGTGLGLSTVYGIVKQSGGNIWVYSEPGKGTTFKIYLPRVDEPLEEPKGEVKKEGLPHGSETVLIVEDDEDVRKFAARVLERQGYTVLVASQGSDALPLCGEYKKPIHMVLCDVVMPGIGGRELTDHLISLHPEMKVLYMSGYTENAIVHHGILTEGMNYIQKPFTVEGLVRKVREALA